MRHSILLCELASDAAKTPRLAVAVACGNQFNTHFIAYLKHGKNKHFIGGSASQMLPRQAPQGISKSWSKPVFRDAIKIKNRGSGRALARALGCFMFLIHKMPSFARYFEESREGKEVCIGGSLLLAMRRCIGEEEPSSGNFMVPLSGLCRSANDAPLGAPY